MALSIPGWRNMRDTWEYEVHTYNARPIRQPRQLVHDSCTCLFHTQCTVQQPLIDWSDIVTWIHGKSTRSTTFALASHVYPIYHQSSNFKLPSNQEYGASQSLHITCIPMEDSSLLTSRRDVIHSRMLPTVYQIISSTKLNNVAYKHRC
jgi:hypothetical protein